jgi:MFS family permease
MIMKKVGQEETTKIEYFYRHNGFFELLKATKKYKELIGSTEALVSLILSIIFTVAFYFISGPLSEDKFNELIRSLLLNITAGLISVLGFTVGALAIMSGTISNRLVNKVVEEEKIKYLMGVIYSFYFSGVVIGCTIISFLFMYLISYSNLQVTAIAMIGVSMFLSYFFWFSIIYSIALLGTCVRIFLLNYKFSQE